MIMPGIVDTHVHINEPGRANWEGFRTATQAAAAGGVTTLIEMPLNSIPATTSFAEFQRESAALRNSSGRTLASGAASCPATPRKFAGYLTRASTASNVFSFLPV